MDEKLKRDIKVDGLAELSLDHHGHHSGISQNGDVALKTWLSQRQQAVAKSFYDEADLKMEALLILDWLSILQNKPSTRYVGATDKYTVNGNDRVVSLKRSRICQMNTHYSRAPTGNSRTWENLC